MGSGEDVVVVVVVPAFFFADELPQLRRRAIKVGPGASSFVDGTSLWFTGSRSKICAPEAWPCKM